MLQCYEIISQVGTQFFLVSPKKADDWQKALAELGRSASHSLSENKRKSNCHRTNLQCRLLHTNDKNECGAFVFYFVDVVRIANPSYSRMIFQRFIIICSLLRLLALALLHLIRLLSDNFNLRFSFKIHSIIVSHKHNVLQLSLLVTKKIVGP